MGFVYVGVDVDLSEFDDDDIREEYEDRFGGVPNVELKWEQLFYIRRDKPLEEFLSVIDTIIMNNSGRIL